MSLTPRLKPEGSVPGPDTDGRGWGRPNIVVLMERPNPGSWALRRVAGLGRRLGAELLIAAVVTYDGSEVDRHQVRIAEEGLRKATARLIEQGARATGIVRLVGYADQALSASDLSDQLDADLVIVLARRGSWLRLFPGSALAHQLMRRGRRPVLVVPDHERRRSWSSLLLGLVNAHAS